MVRLPAVLACLALLLAACSSGQDDGPSTGGTVLGTVLVGPTCPVETTETPCPDEPGANVRVQALRSGDVVATTTSGADGSFEMALPAGSYLLQALPEDDPATSSAPTRVLVIEGESIEVTVLLDTGIRTPEG
ncbi:MAG: hypothetical protein ACXWEH_05555 [Actinomycetota bacterium]